ncbi:PepSY domain-containing protein [Halorussus limi]|uniref:PepSY domain-containing protein n=1 Tax=Halorussus limi TaxID=2938695 RepID=A0A8U0HZ82_9EURY|nr:PepSY domain-containing protein [Halorussus limi]UPV75966.1 PepSY domain-containing protein [Halorussus limi]
MNYNRLVSVGLVLCLLGGGLAGVTGADSLSAESQTTGATERPTESAVAPQADGVTNALQQGGQVNVSGLNVSAVEAVETAQNRTDGKAVVVGLATQNGTPVFNVSVLAENRSVSQVTVDATDRSVLGVRRNITVVDRQFLGGEAFDYAELRTVDEAIRLVRNETNGTVVNAGIRRGELVYGVGLRTPDGRQTQALVAATNGTLLGLQTRNATTTTTQSGA